MLTATTESLIRLVMFISPVSWLANHSPDAESLRGRSSWAAARDAFQRVAHLIVVEHPEIAPYENVLGITLVNSYYAVDRYAVFTFGILATDGVCQIAVNGREITAAKANIIFFISSYYVSIPFLCKLNDGTHLTLYRQGNNDAVSYSLNSGTRMISTWRVASS